MCCNNFHIVLFSGYHLTAVMVFLRFWSFHVMFLCCDCVPPFSICFVYFFPTTSIRAWFDLGLSVFLCSMVVVLSDLPHQKKKGGVVKELLGCSHKFHCAIWAREN